MQPNKDGAFITKSELEDLQVHLDEKFFLIDRQFLKITNETNGRFAEMDKKIDQKFEEAKQFTKDAFYGLENVMNVRFDEVDRRFDRLEGRFDGLESLVKDIADTLKKK